MYKKGQKIKITRPSQPLRMRGKKLVADNTATPKPKKSTTSPGSMDDDVKKRIEKRKKAFEAALKG